MADRDNFDLQLVEHLAVYDMLFKRASRDTGSVADEAEAAVRSIIERLRDVDASLVELLGDLRGSGAGTQIEQIAR